MNKVNLDAVGIPLIEMRCPECKALQQFKVRRSEPSLTRCHSCHRYLMVELKTKEKPNNVLLTLFITAVPLTQEQPVPNAQCADKALARLSESYSRKTGDLCA